LVKRRPRRRAAYIRLLFAGPGRIALFSAVPAVPGAMRGFFAHHRCPVHGMWSSLLAARNLAGRKENVGAKRFAAKVLFLASTVALVLLDIDNPL